MNNNEEKRNETFHTRFCGPAVHESPQAHQVRVEFLHGRNLDAPVAAAIGLTTDLKHPLLLLEREVVCALQRRARVDGPLVLGSLVEP